MANTVNKSGEVGTQNWPLDLAELEDTGGILAKVDIRENERREDSDYRQFFLGGVAAKGKKNGGSYQKTVESELFLRWEK